MQTLRITLTHLRLMAAVMFIAVVANAILCAEESTRELNIPPEGFTALFNGKDLTGWRVNPKVTEMWSIEDGVLKAHGLLEQWGADLVTVREYQDYVLMADFRMPALSDSGIHFRNLAPAMLGKMGDAEQFNIHPKGGMGHLESFRFVPESMGLTEDQLPKVKHVDPEIGVWHTVKLTVVGKTVTAELNGDVILDHFEYPEGILSADPNPIRFQKHSFTRGAKPGERNPCPIEFRNIFIKEIKASGSHRRQLQVRRGGTVGDDGNHALASVATRRLNVPPPGFIALFNGSDFTGWRMSSKAKEMWSIEDGVLKSPGLLREWGADLQTEKAYRDFVLMLDFRMPSLSDSGIMFRRLIPEIPNFGTQEQFNLRSKDGVGHLESYYFLPHGIARNRKLREEDEPHIRVIDPEIGVWHTVKLTMQGRTLSAEYDGEVLYDRFTYPDWMMNLEPAPIRLQKHVFFDDDILGKMNPCPIEYRNIFIRELDPSDATAAVRSPSQGDGRSEGRSAVSSDAKLLARIDKTELPPEYDPAKHQEYIDRHWPKLSPEQVAWALQLWKLKQEIDPDMPNRGFSFVKIMTYAAN